MLSNPGLQRSRNSGAALAVEARRNLALGHAPKAAPGCKRTLVGLSKQGLPTHLSQARDPAAHSHVKIAHRSLLPSQTVPILDPP